MLPNLNDLDAETIALIELRLPTVALEFARIIGLKNSLALIAEFGGTVMRFPKSANGPGSCMFAELADVIGAENTILLGAEYSCEEELYIPLCSNAMKELRNREMISAFDRMIREMSAKKALNKLARLYRCSAKNVENIVNGKSGLGSSRPSRAQKLR